MEQTLSYYILGTLVYTFNNNDIVRVIITSVDISINTDNIPKIFYTCHFNTDMTGNSLKKTHNEVFLTKEDLIKSL